MRWTIFYKREEVSGSTVEEWLATPDKGVQGVVALYGKDKAGNQLSQVAYGSDWYGFDGTRIHQGQCSSTVPGVWHSSDGIPNPKRGKWIADAAFDAVLSKMRVP
jgi:hypothetical protein